MPSKILEHLMVQEIHYTSLNYRKFIHRHIHLLTVFISFWLLQLCANSLFKQTLHFFRWFTKQEYGLGVPIYGKPFQGQYLKEKQRKCYIPCSIADSIIQELLFVGNFLNGLHLDFKTSRFPFTF